MIFRVDTMRAAEVLDRILDRYQRGAYPYNLKSSMLDALEMPKRLKRGGEDEARWWFFACMLMRGGVDSDTALAAISKLYDAEMRQGGKWPFRPQQAANMTPEQMSGLLQDVGTGLYRLARDWVNCATLLKQRYRSSVLCLLEQIHDYDSAVNLLRNRNGDGFPGFQYKMVSMLLFFMTEANLIPYFPYPPPVDFHLQRVAVETEIIRRTSGSETIAYNQKEHDHLQAVLRDLFLGYITRCGIKSNELSDALWLHSRMMCRWNPGNRSSRAIESQGRSPVLT
jgi:hypothetical protein